MIDDRKYLKDGYTLEPPECRDTSITRPFKSTFIDTNRISTIERSLGDFKRVSEEIKKRREQEKQRKLTEEHPTDLQLVREKRDELQEMINKLKFQIEQAQSLLDECNVALGENEKDKSDSF